MAGLKSILKKILPENIKMNDIETENISNSSYSPVPLTLALRKRKYEEEQFAKYGIHKEKMYEYNTE